MKRLPLLAGVSLAVVSACNGSIAAGPSDAGFQDASPDDATPEDASRDAGGACATGTITFSFHADSATSFCVGAANSCGGVWLTIYGANGDELMIDRPCSADCGGCTLYPCPSMPCMLPQHMTGAGVQRTWDGSYYTASTCGAGIGCVERSCIETGHYTARMCAYADLGSTPSDALCRPAQAATCTDVAFDWPPAATVDGHIGENCCPASWLLYGCTYPDGGAGLACHNPALGCASSTTCGQGCDAVVNARCDGG
jgi:hypothetical protein